LWSIFFEIGSLELFAQGWLQTVILLISASWVARIIGVSHWHLAGLDFLLVKIKVLSWESVSYMSVP
jgi:hypothetical protein